MGTGRLRQHRCYMMLLACRSEEGAFCAVYRRVRRPNTTGGVVVDHWAGRAGRQT